jgi:hypothetical protein
MLPPVTCLADLPADAGIGPLLNTRGEQLIILVQGTEARTHMGCSQNLPKEMSSVRSLNTKGLPLTCKLSIQFNSIQSATRIKKNTPNAQTVLVVAQKQHKDVEMQMNKIVQHLGEEREPEC